MIRSFFNSDTETAQELFHIVASTLVTRLNMDEEAASKLADEITAGIRHDVGGGPLYIPGPNRAMRNEMIRDEFRDNNHEDLAKKHELSVRQIERIVRPDYIDQLAARCAPK
ncbi:Mor transcription activator family protein [Marinobacter sp.]|uniref:Mor transcription activator family protein n=1 Tax=Marinobacter sp. TaxID=50741 RepID=UPI003F9E9095